MDRLYSAIQVPHMEKIYDNIRIMVLLLWLLSVSSIIAYAQKTLVCDAATHTFPYVMCWLKWMVVTSE